MSDRSAVADAGHSALAVYDAALRRAGAGRPATLTVRDDLGDEFEVDAAAWCRSHLPGDTGLLDRCHGATLDVGCGPGRLVGALARRGRPALGIDISPAAVLLARRRGAAALRRDVFGHLPGLGRWRSVLLADGNIGIAGDPAGLLRRCRALVADGGSIHVELAAPGSRSWAGRASIRIGDGADGAAWFRWASVAAQDMAALAEEAALRTVSTWTEAGRWFASLTHA
jgi:SAM-dependent methyltransferase